MLFLLMQITMASSKSSGNIGVSSPWTEYVKMLPECVPLPTTWNEEQMQLLTGTSLEVSLSETNVIFPDCNLPLKQLLTLTC